jgi:hypothetical protein
MTFLKSIACLILRPRWGAWIALDGRPAHDIVNRREVRTCQRCGGEQARHNAW